MKSERVLPDLWEVIDDRFRNPSPLSYTSSLFQDSKGIDKPLEKVGEEAVEFILAAKGESRERIIAEAADLQFHLFVAMRAAGITFDELLTELSARKK
ncbi:MAG: phosphoribosyl-ATP diphosphatase [Methanomicrobiales archaeon]|nr:phosphoribosyl-ATP diphosphatase [Methanomicrobiales archaeon]